MTARRRAAQVRPATVAVAVLVALVALGGCGSDGRTLRPPSAGATAPPPPSVTTTIQGAVAGPAGSATASGTATPLVLTSPAFAAGAPIPKVHTCDGTNVSPPLAWGATPAGTVELALTVVDPDANGFVHWVIAAIDPGVQAFAEGTVPDGAVQATNDGGRPGWTGPCPPAGAPHHYVFELYALTAPSGVTDGMKGRDAVAQLARTPAAVATLTGTYQRGG